MSVKSSPVSALFSSPLAQLPTKKPSPTGPAPQPAAPPAVVRAAPKIKYDTDVAMPDLSAGDPDRIWSEFFQQHRPSPVIVSDWVLKLHTQKNYKQVIACLKEALVNGQSQPWMYEVLALCMEIEHYPKADVERVVLSMTDFGSVSYENMMYSAAYLTRFGRKSTALTLYRQASRMLPERPEAYALGLKLAVELSQPEDVEWAASGILLHNWGADFVNQHKNAENALREQIARARKKQDEATAKRLEETLAQSRSCDLKIRLEWNGPADLDLQVEEPDGNICSVEAPLTVTGGIFLHDGVGPDSKNSYELYVCPLAVPGPYRISVKNSGGRLVGDRATLTATMLEGMPDQARVVRTLVLDGAEPVGLILDLPRGRRTERRPLTLQETMIEPLPDAPAKRIAPPQPRGTASAQARQALSELAESRQQQAWQVGRSAGAIGFAPVIQTINSGTTLQAQAVVSQDRRYVKMGINAAQNELVDVLTFSYLSGASGVLPP